MTIRILYLKVFSTYLDGAKKKKRTKNNLWQNFSGSLHFLSAICVSFCLRTQMHTHTHTPTHTYTYIHIPIYTHKIHRQIYIHIYEHVHTHIKTYVCIYKHKHIYYTHGDTQRQKNDYVQWREHFDVLQHLQDSMCKLLC